MKVVLVRRWGDLDKLQRHLGDWGFKDLGVA